MHRGSITAMLTMFTAVLALDQTPLSSALIHINIAPVTNEGSTHSPWNPTTPDDGSSHYFVGDALPTVPRSL